MAFVESALNLALHWRSRAILNAVGCLATSVVLVVVLASKFTIGAWIPAVLIPVALFRGIRRHYDRVYRQLELEPGWRPPPMNHMYVVLVNDIHKGVVQAPAYATSLEPRHLCALSVVFDEEQGRTLAKEWAEAGVDVPLHTVLSPYRRLMDPIIQKLDELEGRWDDDIITVVIPEFVVRHWWEHLLHNRDALHVKARLWVRRATVVTSVPTTSTDPAVEPADLPSSGGERRSGWGPRHELGGHPGGRAPVPFLAQRRTRRPERQHA
jgi:hypothetical protein